ncbi:MAG: YbhB/YbcL family Raf kinase inhibitor-like protein [Thermoguttaceae bacterium]|nr:YbhB/YbcL family Raf kinase inhibitor-like protein [Thermoguttaceae bacterium]MDW8079523.1 YbhB/YbcL family Raf kinase inhibitor-like protein [Thermoguttaceae bacterium]
MSILVCSPAFKHGERIPTKYTADGQDISPPINWSNLPKGTKELVLICEDPDAPTAEPWIHWIVYKIPAELPGLPEGLPREARLREPPGVLQGKNSWTIGPNIGYRGPAPPPGSGIHRYFFRIYALDSKPVIEPGKDKKSLWRDISGHIIGEGELMGVYSR